MHVLVPSLFALSLLPAPALAQAHPGAPAPGPAPRVLVDVDAPAALPPGNILLVILDDVGVDMLTSYGVGSDLPPTPTLDALAAQGVRFRRAYSTPQGSSTMATIETGRVGELTGVGFTIYSSVGDPPLALSETILPEMLDAGTGGLYSHAMIGKWFLGNDASVGGDSAPNVMGYSHFSGTPEQLYIGGYDYFTHAWVEDGEYRISDVYATTQVVDEALEWITTAPEPWFCHVAFNACHTPYHEPPQELHTQVLPPSIPPHGNPRPWYKAMLEALDTELGRLLAELGPDVLERTTVLVIADNGTPNDSIVPPFVKGHGKLTIYEGGINVPFIASGYRVDVPGRDDYNLVSTTDVFATVAELAGVDLDTAFPQLKHQSISFAGHLFTPIAPRDRTHVFSEKFYPNGFGVPQTTQDYALVGPRYKLMRRWNVSAGFYESMFDLAADPNELNDLIEFGTEGLTAEEAQALEGLQRLLRMYVRQ